MDLRDVLSEQDKTRLKNYINIYSGANIECQDVDKVLAEWARAKVDLYHILGDQLIVDFPFEYHRLLSDISDECYMAIYGYDVVNPAYCEMFTALDTYWKPLSGGKGAIENNSIHNHEAWPSAIFNDTEIIATNVLPDWMEGYKVQNKETGKEVTFHKGEKYFRALGKLIHNCPLSDEVFENFRIKMSQITNQKILKGTMCISIHPMDYVTMSDNDYDWDSCMNWTSDEGGDYRLGTVEMMNSPMVVCAYLKGDREFQWGNYHISNDPNYCWNSKKWRELFIVQPDFNIEVKAYPYDNEEFTKVVMDKLEELMGSIHKEEIYWNYQTYFNDGSLEIKFITNDNGMYNDFGTYRNQKGHLMRYNKKLVGEWMANKFNRKYINYSGEPHCMCCGTLINSYEAQSNQVVCGNCGDYVVETCCCCGCSIYNNDDVYWNYDGSNPYCSECYNDIYIHDDITDEDIYRTDAIQFCLMDHETALDDTTVDTAFGPKYKINDYLNRAVMNHATYDELISEFELTPHMTVDYRCMSAFPAIYYYTFEEIAQNDNLLNFFGFVKDDDKFIQARGKSHYADVSGQVLNFEQQVEAYKKYHELAWYRERKSYMAPHNT